MHQEVLLPNTVKVPAPPMYQVVLLNDDFTPMDFVVKVLEKVFHKDANEAVKIMLKIHGEGRGVAGVYSREIAETRVMQTRVFARSHNHPLQALMELA